MVAWRPSPREEVHRVAVVAPRSNQPRRLGGLDAPPSGPSTAAPMPAVRRQNILPIKNLNVLLHELSLMINT